jgi:hypothetical protein
VLFDLAADFSAGEKKIWGKIKFFLPNGIICAKITHN